MISIYIYMFICIFVFMKSNILQLGFCVLLQDMAFHIFLPSRLASGRLTCLRGLMAFLALAGNAPGCVGILESSFELSGLLYDRI